MIRTMSEMRFRIPEYLNIDEVISTNENRFKRNGLAKDKLLFIIDSLICSRANHRKELNYRKKSFVSLSSELLQEVIHDYEKHLIFLVDSDIIECDNLWIRGKKCRGYRFSSDYEGQTLKQIVVNNYKLKKARNRSFETRIKEAKKDAWGYAYLTKWWDKSKIKIDLAPACELLDLFKAHNIENVKESSKTRKAKRIKRIIDTTEDAKLLAWNINERKAHYRFSGEGHRFYNPITNLKREIRNFLTYDGKPLTEIDMKNSQPFLATCLFKCSFWESLNEENNKNLSIHNIDKHLYNKIRFSKVYRDIITLLKTSETFAEKDSPFQKFTDLVVSGEFYEYIQKHFEPLYPKIFKNRTKVKVGLLTIFYLDNQKAPYNKPSQTFKEHFPEVYQLFRLIKSIESNLLPILLQRIESFLILDVICKKISVLHPDIPLFTIHDSILCTQGNEAIVEEIMAREIANWAGHKASFGRKDLLPMQLAA